MSRSKIKKNKKNNTYYFVIEAGRDPMTGKRKQIRRSGFLTLKEAELEYSRLLVELEENAITKSSNMKYSDYLREWLEMKRIKLRTSTYSSYVDQIQNNVIPHIGEIRLDEFDERILQNYVTVLYNVKKLAPATIRTTFGIVADSLYHAIENEMIKRFRIDSVTLPRETKKFRVWDEDQIKIFLSAPDKILNLSRLYIGLEIAILTGMRRGEVLGLRWKDIDFENKIITIQQTLTIIDEKKKTYGLVEEGKTSSAMRKIYISDSLVDSLLKHKAKINREKEILSNEYNDLDLVVCTKNGNFVHPNNLRRAFKNITEHLGLPEIRLHDLRHTHATFLMSKKINPIIVQERLGHKNVNTTLKTYTHALPSMQLEAVEKFDKIFDM